MSCGRRWTAADLLFVEEGHGGAQVREGAAAEDDRGGTKHVLVHARPPSFPVRRRVRAGASRRLGGFGCGSNLHLARVDALHQERMGVQLCERPLPGPSPNRPTMGVNGGREGEPGRGAGNRVGAKEKGVGSGHETYRTLASIFQVMSVRRRTASSSLAFQRK